MGEGEAAANAHAAELLRETREAVPRVRVRAQLTAVSALPSPEEIVPYREGLVLHEARRIPEVGQAFAFHGFRFEIVERQRNQITSIKVTRQNGDGTEAPDPRGAKEPADPG